MWTPLDYFGDEGDEEPIEASIQIEESLKQNLEEYKEPGDEWSYGVLNDPDIRGIVPEESGEARIYENNDDHILTEEYSNAVEYLGERMDLDSIDHVGTIDPFDSSSAPTRINMMQELDEREVIEIEMDLENDIEIGKVLHTQVFFGNRVDGVYIFSRYIEPRKRLDFDI